MPIRSPRSMDSSLVLRQVGLAHLADVAEEVRRERTVRVEPARPDPQRDARQIELVGLERHDALPVEIAADARCPRRAAASTAHAAARRTVELGLGEVARPASCSTSPADRARPRGRRRRRTTARLSIRSSPLRSYTTPRAAGTRTSRMRLCSDNERISSPCTTWRESSRATTAANASSTTAAATADAPGQLRRHVARDRAELVEIGALIVASAGEPPAHHSAPIMRCSHATKRKTGRVARPRRRLEHRDRSTCSRRRPRPHQRIQPATARSAYAPPASSTIRTAGTPPSVHSTRATRWTPR